MKTKVFKKHALAMLIVTTSLTATEYALSEPITSAATDSVTGHKPTLTGGAIDFADTNSNGILDIGEIVSVQVEGDFNDSDGDSAITPHYQWMANDSAIDGANDSTYEVRSSELGMAITLRVTPKTDPNITEPAEGDPIQYSGEIQVVDKGSLISVSISGSPMVHDTLTANALCTSESGEAATCEPGSVSYQWQIENSPGSGTFIDIPSQSGEQYQPSKDDQKKKIKVTVTEK